MEQFLNNQRIVQKHIPSLTPHPPFPYLKAAGEGNAMRKWLKTYGRRVRISIQGLSCGFEEDIQGRGTRYVKGS